MQNINIFLAFVAGVVSFVSPCVLPLVPSYISFIGGHGLGKLREDKVSRGPLLIKTLFFVLGFTIIFVVMGIVFSGTAAAFSGATRWINIIAGSVVVLFGLNLLFNFLKFLNYEKRFHFTKAPAGAGGALLLGMAFAAGWSPCIGPILASILALAASSRNLSSGVLLLSVYSFGLALPFILTSLFLSRAERVLQKIKPQMLKIQRFSGIVLIVIGILIISGQYQQITSWIFLISFRVREWHGANPLASRVLFTALFLIPAVFIARPFIARKRNIASAPIRITLVILFVLTATLQLAGVVELPLLLASWLGFQGI